MNSIALDVHAHLVPFVPERLESLPGVECLDGKLKVDGHLIGVDALYRPDQLVAWMAANRVERAFVSAPPPTYRAHLPPAESRSWMDYLNRGLAETCARFADRLVHLTHLPLEHPALAAEIGLETTRRGLRLFSAGVGAGAQVVLSGRALEPLWRSLHDAGAFLFLHPGECCDARLRAFYLENLLGNPQETAVAAAHLVFAGIPARFSRIKFCLAHGGGHTAMVAGRWQRGFDTARPGVNTACESPKLALRRFFVDCIVHDPAALALVASVFGPERILFGSDWPFPMGLPEPHEQLSANATTLAKLIFEENPRSLTGFKR